MKLRAIVFAGLLGLLLFGCGQLRGSGILSTEEFPVDELTHLDVSSAFEVELRFGEPAVKITADDNLIDQVDVEILDGTVVIELQGPANPTTLKALVYTNQLTSLSVAGASKVEWSDSGADAWQSKAEIDVAGASSVLGTLDVADLDLEVSGASSISLSGNATKADMDISGASSANMFTFSIVQATVDVSGASSADIAVSDQLDITVSGGSKVRNKGNPSGTQDISFESSYTEQ